MTVANAACTSPILVIGGPTAAGKSGLAMEICREVGGEIVSADSVQVYRGMDVGSAKPTALEQAEVPHHLLDIAEPTEQLDAQVWAEMADAAIAGILERGNLPIIVGGTGLYLRALLNGFDEMPAVDPTVRTDLRARLQAEGPQALHRSLAEVDAVAAARLAPGDGQRVTRALEVYLSSGKTLTQWHSDRPDAADSTNRRYPGAAVFGVWPERTVLHERIAARVEVMLADGWVQEVRALMNAGVSVTEGPLTLLGYRDVVAHIQGFLPAAGLAGRIAQGHRQYAKRQLTWFRGSAARSHGLQHVPRDNVSATAKSLGSLEN